MSEVTVPITSPLSSTRTVGSLIEETKQHLHTGARESRNKLSSAITSLDTNLNFTFDLARIGPGARISVDLEDMHVWSVASQSAVVERGQYGSMTDSHAANAMVFVDSRYTPAEIYRELSNVILSLPGLGVYQMLTVDLTFDASVNGYDLSGVTNLLEIYAVYYDTGVRSEWRRVENYTYAPSLPATAFPSTNALFIYDGGIQNRTVRVQYRAKTFPITSLNDNVNLLGVPDSAIDLLPLGAAINLVAGTEIRRNDLTTQGDTRRPGEVPAGAALRSNLGLVDRFTKRLQQEVDNLYALYPPLQPRIWNW